MRGLTCFRGQNCPYFHPFCAQAHVATVSANTPTMATEQPEVIDINQLHETDKMWWPNSKSWTLTNTITSLTSNIHTQRWYSFTKIDIIISNFTFSESSIARLKMYHLYHTNLPPNWVRKETHASIKHTHKWNWRWCLHYWWNNQQYHHGWHQLTHLSEHEYTGH